MEPAQPADRLGPVDVQLVERLGAVARGGLDDHRHGQEGLDPVRHRDRPRSRPAPAVRLGEGLVQVEVDDVEPHVAGPRDAHHGVQVRAVVVERRPRLVHDPRDLLDVAVEQAERVRIRQHQAGHVRAGLLAQVVEVDAAVVGGADLHHLVAGHRHAGRVRAVGGVGREHLGPHLAAVLVVRAREQQAGQLPVRARARLQRDVREARDLREIRLEAPHELEGALRIGRLLERVQPGVPGQRRHPLVDLRVVLHRARAERVEARVEVEVLLREVVVVPDDLGLGHLRQRGRLAADRRRGEELLDRPLRDVRGRRCEGAPALARALEDRDRPLLGRPHATTSSREAATSAARRSMSSRVRRSVIATSRPSPYSG